MGGRRRAGLAVLVGVTTAGLLVAVVVTAQAGEAENGISWVASGASDRPDGDEPDLVTLVTGDQVAVSADGEHYSIRRGKGREQVRFSSWRAGRDLMVVPSDALRLLKAGTLDSRLFDVSLLRTSGYHGRAELPLIIMAAGTPGTTATRSAVRSSVTDGGAVVDRELPAVNGLASHVDEARLGGFWRSLTGGAASRQLLRGQVSKVWLDVIRRPSLDKACRKWARRPPGGPGSTAPG